MTSVITGAALVALVATTTGARAEMFGGVVGLAPAEEAFSP